MFRFGRRVCVLALHSALFFSAACYELVVSPPDAGPPGLAPQTRTDSGEPLSTPGIDAGVSESPAAPDAGTPPPARIHPPGWAEPLQHGAALKVQGQPCQACHGADLAGSPIGPSCDTCHTLATPGAWRTDCTYCHGGIENLTGAPPRDLVDPPVMPVAFAVHSVHVASPIAKAAECGTCHVQPSDVLAPGHVFDESPGRAEVDFQAGISPLTTWSAGTCANLYCHGDGRTEAGVISAAAAKLDCAGCHPGPATQNRWNAMSGEHAKHLREDGMSCPSCHLSVTADGATIATAALHVDRQRQVVFNEPGIVYDPITKRCAGPCHGEDHDNTAW